MVPRSIALACAILAVLAGCTSGVAVSPSASPAAGTVQPSGSSTISPPPATATATSPSPAPTPAPSQATATPTAQTGTAIGNVVADGVRVRSMPTVDPASIKYVPLLRGGDRVFVAAGPVAADGYDWFLVDTLVEWGERPLFGWAAFESRDGEVWIAGDKDVDCPALPKEAQQLGITNDDVLIHCFGSRDQTFELEANLNCSPDDPARVEHEWLARECSLLSGDACGSCGLRIAAHPDSGIELPDRPDIATGLWAITGHFDDPAAASCAIGRDADDGLLAEWAVHYCRGTFVMTALERQ
jgi:hypothetical protein